jgi:hypothetical protein
MALNFGALGFSLLSGGLDIFNQYSQSNTQLKQARRRVAYENAMAQASRNFQNLQIRRSNEYQRQAFETQKGIYRQQVAFNQDAANRAYEGIQFNRNEQLAAVAFQRQDVAQNLLRAVGANNASIDPGNASAARAADLATLGVAGRQQTQLGRTVRGIDIGTEQSMRDTAAQQHSADLQAWSQVAIAPYMQSELPPAVSAPMPRGMSGLSQGLMIGGAVLGGLGTYNSMAPTGSKLWGANLPNARTGTA